MTGTHGTPKERLLRRLIVGGPDECWLWTGVTIKGHGQISVNSKPALAHRVAYEVFVGPIPDGMQIDHECHNVAVLDGTCDGGPACAHRRCCNPAHLVAKTGLENQRGGVQDWTEKGTCIKGHPTAVFRHRSSGGQTYCKRCRNDDRNRRRRERQLAS